VHALIGVGEGLITIGALSFLAAARRDLLDGGQTRASSRGFILGGLGIAALLALVSPLASGDPDGLERVAEDIGFLDKAQDAPYQIIPDYVLPGVPNEAIATILAGIVGLLIVFGAAYLIGRMRRHAA
jgi:cobalt/nickel transport system permease protein